MTPIHSNKTAALIQSSMMIGAVLAGADTKQINDIEKIGYNIGIAFQIQDDILDVIGDAKQLGKAVGVDETKNTFVRLYGLEKCEELVKIYTEKAIEAISIFESNEYITALATELTTRTV